MTDRSIDPCDVYTCSFGWPKHRLHQCTELRSLNRFPTPAPHPLQPVGSCHPNSSNPGFAAKGRWGSLQKGLHCNWAPPTLRQETLSLKSPSKNYPSPFHSSPHFQIPFTPYTPSPTPHAAFTRLYEPGDICHVRIYLYIFPLGSSQLDSCHLGTSQSRSATSCYRKKKSSSNVKDFRMGRLAPWCCRWSWTSFLQWQIELSCSCIRCRRRGLVHSEYPWTAAALPQDAQTQWQIFNIRQGNP